MLLVKRSLQVFIVPHTFTISYLVIFFAVEFSMQWITQTAVVAIYCLILLGMILLATIFWREDVNIFLVGMTFIPMMRLASLAIPLQDIRPINRYAAITILLTITIYGAISALQLNRLELNLTFNEIIVQFSTVLLGVLYAYLIFVILRPRPIVDVTSQFWLFFAIGVLFVNAVVEELAFRGVVQYICRSVFGEVGIFYTAAFWAIPFVMFQSLPYLLLAYFVGLSFSWISQQTQSIFGVTLAHWVLSVCALLIFPAY